MSKAITKWSLAFALLCGLTVGVTAQNVLTSVSSGPNLPTTCTPKPGGLVLFFKTTSPIGLHQCTATNTWEAVESGGAGGAWGSITGTLSDQTDLQNALNAKSATTYVDAQIAGLNTATAAQDSFLVSGGQVTWQSDYDFLVSAAIYYIRGVKYSSPQTSITLDAADGSNDRIDVIAVNTSGSAVKITGTAAAQPSEADVDPSTQLKLSLVLVGASTTQPDNVANTTVYAENAGDPAEWDATTSGSGIVTNSTNNPRTGTTVIEATNMANNAYVQLAKGSGSVDPNSFDFLVVYIRSKATWNNNRVLRIQLQSTGVKKGNALTIASGYFGFDSSNTTDYQQIAIPMSQFAVTAGVTINQIRITDSGGAIGFYIDDIAFQTGAITQQGTGITQAQADARYQSLLVNSAGLAAALSDETGSGLAVFGTSPAITTSLTTPSTTFALVNATATTVNFAGAATTLNMAGGSGAVISLGGGANAANLRFLEPSGSGTNYTQFKAQAQSGDITYTLPPANVTNGYLKNDGSGGLVWETVSGAAGATGDYQINNGGAFAAGVIAEGSTGRLTATPTAASSGVAPYLRVITPADTNQTLNTEFPGIVFGGNASGATVIRTGADGTTYALQREYIFTPPTYAYAGATTVTEAITLDTASPIVGSSATFSSAYAGRFVASAAAHIPLVAKGATSQSGDLFRAQNSSATTLARISSAGNIFASVTGTSEGTPQVVGFEGTFGAARFQYDANSGMQLASGRRLQLYNYYGIEIIGGFVGGTPGFVSGATSDPSLTVIGPFGGGPALATGSPTNTTIQTVVFTAQQNVSSTVLPMLKFQSAPHIGENAATGFGSGIVAQLNSSTTANQNAAQIAWVWTDATHATRTAAMDFYTVYQAAALSRALRIAGDRSLNIANAAAAPAAAADSFSIWSADAVAGSAQAYAINEAGEINRLTGLAAQNSSAFSKTSDTTLATVTGLSRNVEASRTYAFRAYLQSTAPVTGGVKFAVSGTATASAISYEGILYSGAAVVTQTRATALDTVVCDSVTTTAGTCVIQGVITVGNAGTLLIQFAQDTSDGSASTVLANQYFQLIPIS